MTLHELLSRRYAKLALLGPFFFCLFLAAWTFNAVPAVRIPYVASAPPSASARQQDPAPPPPPPKDYWTWDTTTAFRPHAAAAEWHNATNPLCAGFPVEKLETVQVGLKIGAGASKAKIQAQLDSVCACVENLLLFSDLDEAIVNPTTGKTHRAYDVLASLPPSYALDNPDWEWYTRQKVLKAEGRLGDASTEGWKLDRFKFLPMVEAAWKMRPEREWYVFLEDDTYVVWDNLFRFLDHLSPDSLRYMGSPSPGRHTAEGTTTWFAYGGTGFVLSRGAMKKLLHREHDADGAFTDLGISERFENDVKGDCCGDSVLGWALWEQGVELSGHWPMFNPHSIEGVPYSDLYWCQPVITMHRVPAHEMVKLWTWEQEKREELTHPLLYRDLSTYFPLHAAPTRPDWDNAAWDAFDPPVPAPPPTNPRLPRQPHPKPDPETDPNPHASLPACAHACTLHPSCMQYTYHDLHCTFVRSMRFGSHRDADAELFSRLVAEGVGKAEAGERARWMAGWDLGKMERWTGERGCGVDGVEGGGEIMWGKPSLTRIF